MSIIKRISTSLFAQVDQMVGEIENHDALIKAAIREQQKKIANARVQLARLQSSEKQNAEQITALQLKEQRWAERAVREAEEDEEKALVCLQRRQLIREQISRLTNARDNYREAIHRMSADISACDQKLKSLTQKHELMRARQTSVEALNVINEVSDTSIDELETSFERWEARIIQGEIQADTYDTDDSLEQVYVDQENQEQLRADLRELLNKEKDNDEH